MKYRIPSWVQIVPLFVATGHLFGAPSNVEEILAGARARNSQLDYKLLEDGQNVMVWARGSSPEKGYEVLSLESFPPPGPEPIQIESSYVPAGVITAAMAYEEQERRELEENIRKYGVPFLIDVPPEWQKIEIEEKVRTQEEQDELDLAMFAILKPMAYAELREAAMSPREKAEEQRLIENFLKSDRPQAGETTPSR